MSEEAQSGAPVAEELNAGSQIEDADQESVAEPLEEKPVEVKKLRQLQLKVYGNFETEDLPFEIEDKPEVVEYLTKQLQMSKAAQRAMEENSGFQKRVGQFFQDLKSNTRAKLEELGIDPKEFAAAVIEEEIKKQQLSPEEREKQDLQSQLKKLEEERKKEKEDWEKKEFERLQEQEYERIDSQMSQALDKTDLPKSPYVIKKMADYMLLGLQKGVDLTADDVVPLVREEIQNDLKAMFQAMPEEAVEQFLGKDVFNRVRKKNLAKAKQTPASAKAAIRDVGGSSKPASPSDTKVNMKEFFKI